MRRISRCLNNKVIEICQGVVHLEELNSKLSEYLPETLRGHCYAGSFRQGCLVLVTRDSGWASQLRYSLPDLRDKLRAHAGLYQLRSIKVSVAAPKIDRCESKKPTTPISSKACDIIISQAEKCRYMPLQQALYRLADHHKKNKETT